MTSACQDLSPVLVPLSPPVSPSSDNELPIIPTDSRGMIIGNEGKSEKKKRKSQAVKLKDAASRRPKRQPVKYVSRHFSTDGLKKQGDDGDAPTAVGNGKSNSDNTRSALLAGPATPPQTPAKPSTASRVFYGVNVDELSSDSDLTDVPEDIGPDPFESLSAQLVSFQRLITQTKKKRNPTKSPFFPSPHKHRPTFLSTLPFPPLSAPRFGLMQERLATDPFRLLIATIFLNKTPGERAMPVFFQLLEKYPTPADLAKAEVADVTAIIHHLGFQNQRARKCVAMAKMWVEKPPAMGKRYRKLNYPIKGDGRNVKDEEVIDDDDGRVAWEISHLPGVGAYGHDSWRMFCRDRLRKVAYGWNGELAEPDFEPEWKRVLPLDKELRAWMTWMWMKEGWVWNKETGQRTRASRELMEMANGGGIVIEEKEKATLTVQAVGKDEVDEEKRERQIARPAGEILETADLRL